jgi:hypothetical protein
MDSPAAAEAMEYARDIQNPRVLNWVKLEWIWM